MAVFMAGVVQAESVRKFGSFVAVLKGAVPSVARVILCHRGGCLRSSFTEIFLIHNAIPANDERHNPAVPVFHRIRQNSKPACHLSVRNLVLGSAPLAAVPCPVQYSEVVAIERLWLVARVPVSQAIAKSRTSLTAIT
jgi:hypothetical protein